MPSIPTSNTPTQAPAARVIAALDWDQVYGSDPLPAGPNGAAPMPADLARWHDAVRRAGAVVANHPDCVPEPGRFRSALELARAKAVELYQDGTAAVKSGNTVYEIAPECLCKDAETVSKYCKHLLATLIVKEAYCQLQPVQTPTTQPPNGQPAVDGKGHALPETIHAPVITPPAPAPYAPSTLCLKARVGDVEIAWTLRGADEETAARAQRVLKYLDQLKERRPEAPPTGAIATPPAIAATPVTPPCPVHGTAKVARSTLFPGWYCKQKMQDGYCSWSQKD
jgi:hypothetical protein